MLKYIPYVLMFAVATMIIYGWGLRRTMHQKQDLSNMLCSKGISKVKKALKKNKSLTKKELEPFVKDLTAKQPFNSERIGVTDPNAFLDSILPYMLKQKMIKEIREDNFFLSHAPHSDHFPFIGSRMIIQFDRIDRIKRMLFFHFFISAMSFH